MYKITVKLRSFSAAHRLIKAYEGKCRHLHGHNYQIIVHVAAPKTNAADLVLDFSWIHTHCDRWVQAHLDHAVLVCSEDLPLLEFVKKEKQHHYLFPEGLNTSAEALAFHLYHQFSQLLQKAVPEFDTLHLTCVEVWESDRSSAHYGEPRDGFQ